MARDPLRPPGGSGFLVRLLRTVLIALLVAFTIGFLIGTLLRRELEEPVRYFGYEKAPAPAPSPISGPT